MGQEESNPDLPRDSLVPDRGPIAEAADRFKHIVLSCDCHTNNRNSGGHCSTPDGLTLFTQASENRPLLPFSFARRSSTQ
jgi:hypothetical protein